MPLIKVAIIDRGFISPYWRDLFTLLNKKSSLDYTLFHSKPPSGTGLREAEGPYDFPNVRVKRIEIPFLKGSIIYQCLMYRVFRDYDVIIISHELKFVSSMVLALLFKMTRRPVIFWGFGYHAKRGLGYGKDYSRWLTSLIARVKVSILSLSREYLAYTEGGATNLVNAGYPAKNIWVVRQAVNVEEQVLLHEKCLKIDGTSLRTKFGLLPDSVVFLYIGRIVSAKRVPDLIELTKKLNALNEKVVVEALVIGSGPEAELVSELCASDKYATYLGEIYDQDTIAEYLRVVSAVVLPGAAGITVTHAFAHGVPVITRVMDSHSPEAEYVENGINGLMVEGDFSEFVKAVQDFALRPEIREKLAEGAISTRETLSLANMVEQFDACTHSALGKMQE